MTFEVVSHGYARKTAKAPVYKVVFKTPDGDNLTLISDSKDVYAGYPLGDHVTVQIKKTQKTLDEDLEEA
jgi:hypothetical protein